MKRALTILALAAVPVFAEEPAKKTDEGARPQTISAAPASSADSPLVAAARRTNRAKKSAIKITNANLGKYGTGTARITTTAKQEPITMPAPLPPSAPSTEVELLAAREKSRKLAEVEAQKRAKEEADRKAKAAIAAERAEEGMYGETDADVGYGEGEQQQAQRPKEEKPPQS